MHSFLKAFLVLMKQLQSCYFNGIKVYDLFFAPLVPTPDKGTIV